MARTATRRGLCRIRAERCLPVGYPAAHMGVSVSDAATLPQVFAEHASIAEEPVTMETDLIEKNRQRWVDGWIDAVLR